MTNSGSSYSSEQLNELADLIQRASAGVCIARRVLEERLTGLMRAVGRNVGDDERATAFREFADGDPTHAELAERFGTIATSDDPLDPELCNDIVLTKLNEAARRKWARRFKMGQVNRPHPIRGLRTVDLTAEELSDVRDMAAHLARYHQSFVRRAQPTKIDQYTLIEELADIYIECTGLSTDRYQLAHARKSRFVKFAYIAMRPFFGLTEASHTSIYHRWKRIKDKHAEAF